MSEVKELAKAYNNRAKQIGYVDTLLELAGVEPVEMVPTNNLRKQFRPIVEDHISSSYTVLYTVSAMKFLNDKGLDDAEIAVQYHEAYVIAGTENIPPMALLVTETEEGRLAGVPSRTTMHPFAKPRTSRRSGVEFLCVYLPIRDKVAFSFLDDVLGQYKTISAVLFVDEVVDDVQEVAEPFTAVEDVEASVGVHVVPEIDGDFEELEGQVFIFPQPVDNVVEEPARVAETCLIPGESFADMVSNTIKYRAITVPAMPDRAPSIHLEPTWTRDSICVADSKKVSWDWNGHPMDHKTTHYNQAARDLGWSQVGTVLEVVGVDGPAMFLCERGEVQAVFDLLEDPESAAEDLEDSESTASHSLPFEPLRVAEKALTVTKKQAKKLTNKLQHNGWLLVDVEYVDDESGDVEWMMFNKRGEWVRVHLEGWLVLGGDLATPYGNAPHWFLRDAKEYDYMQRSVLAL